MIKITEHSNIHLISQILFVSYPTLGKYRFQCYFIQMMTKFNSMKFSSLIHNTNNTFDLFSVSYNCFIGNRH